MAEKFQEGEALCLYETTVAAGLPVIGTIQNLIATGDVIHSIEGIFSGTLAYLFNVYDGTKPFSQIVSEAKSNGYTEPDPRDDLTGMDVARKLTIIGREAGRDLEISDFKIESLVPDELSDVDADKFLDLFKQYDDEDAFEKDGEFNMTSDKKPKGVIVCFNDGTKPVYEYSPWNCSKIEFEKWYDKIPQGKLVILQSNDYFNVPEETGHVNCSKNLLEFEKQTPMSKSL